MTDLIQFSLSSLQRMQLTDGTFCYERHAGNPAPLGRSLRYTLMVRLGLAKADAAGYDHAFDLAAIDAALWSELDSPELAPGDLGLHLWADARTGAGRGEELARRLELSLAAHGGLGARVGMELGWILIGLAEHVAAAPSDAGRRVLAQAADQLLVANRAPSGLYRHHGSGWRRRFPNFATQIYSLLALALLTRHELDERAAPAAQALAERLLETQLPDGGWPWLFDAERGTVVERYEIYSVHQDAMAPMAFLELADVTGEQRYVDAVERGLRWIGGQNELHADMVDRPNEIVTRSIRRRRGPDRFWLAAKTGASLAGLPTPGSTARATELNRTDRPYHFGWVLEAWCGRESLLG